jgi:hypothetical protein
VAESPEAQAAGERRTLHGEETAEPGPLREGTGETEPPREGEGETRTLRDGEPGGTRPLHEGKGETRPLREEGGPGETRPLREGRGPGETSEPSPFESAGEAWVSWAWASASRPSSHLAAKEQEEKGGGVLEGLCRRSQVEVQGVS